MHSWLSIEQILESDVFQDIKIKSYESLHEEKEQKHQIQHMRLIIANVEISL